MSHTLHPARCDPEAQHECTEGNSDHSHDQLLHCYFPQPFPALSQAGISEVGYRVAESKLRYNNRGQLVLGAVVIALGLGVHDGVVTAVAAAVIGCFTITLGVTGWLLFGHPSVADVAVIAR